MSPVSSTRMIPSSSESRAGHNSRETRVYPEWLSMQEKRGQDAYMGGPGGGTSAFPSPLAAPADNIALLVVGGAAAATCRDCGGVRVQALSSDRFSSPPMGATPNGMGAQDSMIGSSPSLHADAQNRQPFPHEYPHLPSGKM